MRPLPKFLLLCFVLLVVSCSKEPVYKEYRTLAKIGDNPEWAATDWNDDDWDRTKPILDGGEVFWFRTRVDILKAPDPLRPYAIRPLLYGEYEVFWDGVLIGKNGNPGQEAEFGRQGEMFATFILPTHLAEEGEHMFALRASVLHFEDHVGMNTDIAEYDDLLTSQLIETSFMHIFAGAFLIASIYFLFLFLSNKKEYFMLIFSISCFLFFLLNLAQFISTYVPIHYSVHHIRLEAMAILMLGISFLTPLYLSMQFPFPKKKVLIGGYVVILFVVFLIRYDSFTLTYRNMALSMWVFSVGISVFGVYKTMKGARFVLITLLLSLVINFVISYEIGLFFGFSLILLGMFYLLTLRMKEQRLAYETSLVQSTRLQLELLKKNIQPHFLMNTLTSLIDWVEEAPKKGALFIESLAKEFDLFNQVGDQKLIPITQEIALCKTHLEIMGYRKEINYSWEEEGIDPEEYVPPAIIHTLLENGITHSLPLEDNRIRFKLTYESKDNAKKYTFLTFAKSPRKEPRIKEGTGLKYVKARLTESYQSNWDLASESTEDGWKTTITLYS